MQELLMNSIPFKILPEKASLFESLTALDLKCPEAFPGSVRIKHSKARTVYHLTHQHLLLKIFRPVTRLDQLRFTLFSSKAELEFEAIRFAQENHVPTSVPVGFGVDSQRQSYLFIEAIPEVYPLDRLFTDHYLQTKRTQRNEILREIATCIAQMHKGGLLHSDFHAGNILFSERQKKAWIIDLYHYKKNPKRHWNACLQNLVIFNRVFQVKASRTDRFRFFRYYIEGWHSFSKQDCLWLESQTQLSNQQFWRHREQRCFKENKYFGKIAYHHYTGFAKKNPQLETFELPPDYWPRLFEFLQTPVHYPLPDGAVWIKSKSRTTRVLKILYNAQAYYVKQYLPQSFNYQLKSLFRSSRAKKAWFLGYSLLTRGLQTADPILVLEKRTYGLLQDSILVVKEIPSFQETRLLESSDSRQRQLETFARIFRQFHDRGFTHRDLKGPNLLWGTEGLYFIDLDGVSQITPSDTIRCRDLGRFIFWFKEESAGYRLSSEEIDYFIRSYLQLWPTLISSGKEQYYFQTIQRYLEKKLRHRQKKGPRP